MEVVYHTLPSHRNSLPAEGVVFRDLHDDGACLGPGAGVAHVVGGADTEGVGVAVLAHEVGSRLGSGGEPGGPGAITNLHLHVVGGNTGTGSIIPAPGHGDDGRAAARGDGYHQRC